MQALQMVEEGRIDRLIISMPPRHGKSELVSVRFPAWYLGLHSGRDVIHVSYGADLSHDFSRRVRMLVRDDPVYRALFPGVLLDPERQRVNDWRLVNGGGFRSVGAKAGITGHGADLLVIDDPHKEGELTELALDEVYEWFVSAARTRLSRYGAIVLCMTRWHPQDLVGRVIEAANQSGDADQWAVLTLPGLAEPGDVLGREVGEALWPEWFPRESLLAVRALSERDFEALYQQNPRSTAVQMFSAQDFGEADVEAVEKLPGVWAFDLALGESDGGDYSAGARVHYDRNSRRMVFTHLFRERRTWPEMKTRIVELMDAYPGDVFAFPRQTFELMAVQVLRYERPSARVASVSFPAGSDKVSRAQVLADMVSGGRVALEPGRLNGGLTGQWVSEYVAFPAGRHDDVVDVGSVAAHYFGVHREFSAAVVDLGLEARRRAAERAEIAEVVGRVGGYAWAR